jgi:hypothetical protein
MRDAPLYGIEQEHSLELPLSYDVGSDAPRVAVVLHAFHTGLLPEFRAYLNHIPGAADLFISTDRDEKRAAISACFSDWPKGGVEVRVTPNRGRDVAPKLVGFASVHDHYEYVLHLHTKSSPHDSRLAGWRGYLLDTLLGSPATINGVFEVFRRAPWVGMLAPQHIEVLRPWIRWGENQALAQALATRMGFDLPRAAPLDFPSGSMFWARSAALRPLLDLHLGFDDFAAEAGQTDGTLAHAIERLYFLVCEHAGYEWAKITAQGELHEQGGVAAVTSPQELDRFLTRYRLRLMSLQGEERSVEDRPVFATLPPKPRRTLHVTWRAALGDTTAVPPGRVLVIVLHGSGASAASLHSAELALRHLPPGTRGQVLAMPGASQAVAQEAGFARGADLVLRIGAPGLLHPESGAALLRMSEAHHGRALLSALCLPDAGGRAVDGGTFSLPWAAGPAVAVPRAVHDRVGPPAGDAMDGPADKTYSQDLRARGFEVLLCPRAVFYPVPRLETVEDRRVA